MLCLQERIFSRGSRCSVGQRVLFADSIYISQLSSRMGRVGGFPVAGPVRYLPATERGLA